MRNVSRENSHDFNTEGFSKTCRFIRDHFQTRNFICTTAEVDHVYCRQCQPIYRSIQRLIVGRHSVNNRSRLGRQSDDTRSRHGRQSFQMCLGRNSFSFTDNSLTIRQLFADTSPIVRRYFTDVSVSNWSTLGRWSVDTWSIVRRQQEYLKKFMWRRGHGEPHPNGCFGRLTMQSSIHCKQKSMTFVNQHFLHFFGWKTRNQKAFSSLNLSVF